MKKPRSLFLGTQGQRYKLWSQNGTGSGGFGILVKEISKNDVEIRKKSSKVMPIVLTPGKEVE